MATTAGKASYKDAPTITPLDPEDPASEVIRKYFLSRNYELLGEIGRGGMGIVYLAQDIKLGRRVAIKTLSPERKSKQSSLLRFEREARTFAQIRHPHIANLYEFCDEGEYQYLALEYIEGTDLDTQRRSRRQWTSKDVAEVILRVAEALSYTHSKEILHRDIKPANILIERASGRVVLTDFGLAKGSNDITLTASGYAVGTPAYMAPEQISDQFGTKPDGRSDMFSLGTVAYEMITGKHPFLGADDLTTMRAIVQKHPLPLRDIDPSVPEKLERIFLSMLQKNPKDRPANCGEVSEMLSEFLNIDRGGSVASLPAVQPPTGVPLPEPRPVPPKWGGQDTETAAPGISPSKTTIGGAPAERPRNSRSGVHRKKNVIVQQGFTSKQVLILFCLCALLFTLLGVFLHMLVSG